MSGSSLSDFWDELRERQVVRAVLVYGVVAWVLVQVADIFFPALRLPGWTVTLVAALAVLGFPVTVALAWVFERTPAGLRREGDDGVEEVGDPGVRPGAGRRPISGSGLPWHDRRLLLALGLGAAAGILVVGAGLWLTNAVGPAGGAGGSGEEELAAPVPGSVGPGDREVLASVAVLPFDDLSPGRDQSHLSDGITEDILSRLARSEGLRIPSRTTVMRYKDTEKSVPEIGEELGVSHVLEGSVQLAGGRIRVTAQLIDASADDHVWSDSWTRPLEDVFAVQSEIAERVARALEVRLGPGAVSTRGTTPEAYEAYLRALEAERGRYTSVGEIGEVFTEAFRRYQRALELDSTFAPAWAGAAETALWRIGPDTAATLARRALSLDPRSDRAHATLGQALLVQGTPDAAAEQFRLAAAINPNSGEAWFGLGTAHLEAGRHVEAWRALRRGAEVGPPQSHVSLALPNLLTQVGLWEEAAAYLRWIEEIRGQPAEMHCFLAHIEVMAGETAAARRHLDRMMEETPGSPGSLQLQCLGAVRILLGDLEGSAEALRRTVDAENVPVFRSWLAVVEAAADRDPGAEAVRRSEEALLEFEEGEQGLRWAPEGISRQLVYLAAVRGDVGTTAERLDAHLRRFGPDNVTRPYLRVLAPEVARAPDVARTLDEMERRIAEVRALVERELRASPPPAPVRPYLEAR